ncbi:hypothetical protein [Amycolatopsis sp. cg9]|uniref:8-oxoguanine DNA glycosylase OGG fold protein n=1 Tax=Amycolatopsis sp. cg9 TaxID=3238801 RepID=UPI003526B7B1
MSWRSETRPDAWKRRWPGSGRTSPRTGGVQPLIFDRVVARRLPEEAGPASKYGTAWWTSTWSGYLRRAAEQARRPEYGNEPDHVEVALFTGAWTP